MRSDVVRQLPDSKDRHKLENYSSSTWRLLLAVAILVVAVFLRCSIAAVRTTNSDLFITLAQNITQNFCYSASNPSSGVCEPTWAQQPPGYALFIAVTRTLAGASDRAMVVAQTIVFAMSALYFARWLYAWHRISALFHVSLAAALLSPIMFGGSRTLWTELLTAASVMWVMTELLRSVLEGRPRHLPIAAAICAGLLMRWDQITLLPAVAIGLCCAFGWRNTLRPMVVITTICALPYLALMLRAGLVGLPLLPSAIAGEGQLPQGIIAFYRVAALDERATRTLMWPIIERSYQFTALEASDVYASRADPSQVRQLFTELKALPDGQPVPKDLDDAFGEIARQLSQNSLSTQVAVPLIRALRIWSRWLGHPIYFSSVGERGPLRPMFIAHSLMVLAGALAGAVLCTKPLRYLATAAVIFTIVRTAFLVIVPVTAMETRYLDPLFPALDMIAICAMAALVMERWSVSPLACE